jgi:hypothetical protein
VNSRQPKEVHQQTKRTLTPVEVEGTPQQIEGPYFVDDMPNRSDMRIDTSNRSVQEGIPLDLILHAYTAMR